MINSLLPSGIVPLHKTPKLQAGGLMTQWLKGTLSREISPSKFQNTRASELQSFRAFHFPFSIFNFQFSIPLWALELQAGGLMTRRLKLELKPRPGSLIPLSVSHSHSVFNVAILSREGNIRTSEHQSFRASNFPSSIFNFQFSIPLWALELQAGGLMTRRLKLELKPRPGSLIPLSVSHSHSVFNVAILSREGNIRTSEHQSFRASNFPFSIFNFQFPRG
ncbi:MAG: hypothetical protein HOP11_12290 [Saprospiraceae bacterium]|nr:hypothetical protein [Saprospiraceae bacterium]